MEIIKSNRGGDKLCVDGYVYVKKRSQKNWVRWQCQHQRSAGCKEGTNANYDNPRSHVGHNHAADRNGVEVTKQRTTMKAQAKQSTSPKSRPHQILTQYMLQTNDDLRANVGNLETCKRDLRRQRRGCLPKDPTSLRDLAIPEEWKTTGEANPRPFLVHDSGPDAGQRVVVYSAEEQLRHLGQADTWYMDSNFAMSPNVFERHTSVIRHTSSPRRDDRFLCLHLPAGEKFSGLSRNVARCCAQDGGIAHLSRPQDRYY